MDYIKTISGCDNLKDRELNLNGVLIKQKCSIKCVNALKKGNIFKSIKTIPSVDHLNIRDKPNLCGYPYKSKSSNNNKSKSKLSNNNKSKSKLSNNKSKSSVKKTSKLSNNKSKSKLSNNKSKSSVKKTSKSSNNKSKSSKWWPF